MKNVTLRQLKVFEAVASHLSFSRAAQELHLTQPAVSMQVQALVEQAGVALFEQIGKKIFLTAAGEELLRHARRIAQQLREADEAMAAIRGVRGGRLNIGVVSTAKYIAPRLLVAFRDLHPEAELRLGVENRETVVRQLAENEIDLAIMGVPPKDFETVAEIFSEHPHVIVAAPDHPLAAARRIAPEALAAELFLIRESGSGTRAAMERFFGERNVELAKTLELASNETIKQAVMAGMGLSFLSGHSISLELSVGRVVTLDVVGTPVIRHWHIVHRSQKELLPMAAAFLDFVRAEAPRLIADQSPAWHSTATTRPVRQKKK
ncbi:MAG: LysR family transcriptional regulator [Gammaproteobacteria bacterium]|nr:LysR family transcriptional regulator [Gammaproteobacteria bacterium]MBU1644853.1 LysR family transcriptional regulator [Gammaproteobacteria bacterium]MBU1973086.1 LysR family transcriptional regulator [Gammaproteobacteria bacterium]